jgi:hypothetical protein
MGDMTVGTSTQRMRRYRARRKSEALRAQLVGQGVTASQVAEQELQQLGQLKPIDPTLPARERLLQALELLQRARALLG